jgi:protein MAK11
MDFQDCKPKAKVIPPVRTKIHQIHYVPNIKPGVISMSTEDGRILFYSVDILEQSPQQSEKVVNGKKSTSLPSDDSNLQSCTLIGQLGGTSAGLNGRIKDYAFLNLPSNEAAGDISSTLLVVTAGSDGTIRLWALEKEELVMDETSNTKPLETLVGRLLGSYETSNRITCMKSFIMSGSAEGEDEDNVLDSIGNSDSEDSDSGASD